MRSMCYIFLFAATVTAHSISLQARAFVAPKPASHPDVAPIPESPYRPNSLNPDGVRPGRIGSDPDAAAGAAAAAGHGTASDSTAPFKPGPDEKNKELIDKAVEAVSEVFDLLNDIVDLASGGNDDHDDAGDDKWQPSSARPQTVKPTQVASTSDGATNSTAPFILPRNNVTYALHSDPRLLSKDVVVEMAGSSYNRLSTYQDLFTSEEYSMFIDDPICFYAHVESMYLNASSSKESAASITPSPTQAPQRRQASDDEKTSCADIGIPGIDPVCTAVVDSPEWTSLQASDISSLWAHELPDQLWSAHFAMPTATSGDVTATATSTTSCAGLDGGEGPVTRYRELKIRGMDSEETSGTANGGEAATSTPAREPVSAGMKVDGGLFLACLLSAIALGSAMF